MGARRLTEFSHGAGCGCKLAPDELRGVLGTLAPNEDPALLVGATTGDDAAIYRLSQDRALVVTADFITPVVDDARTWGRVAATNAVSDIYAMGGTPLVALNLVAWNSDELGPDLLSEVLAGGQDVAIDAAFVIGGGHSVDDPEPKYGLAVVGEVHPDRVLTNAGLRTGQDIVLTKPLGLGVITTAIKAGSAPPEAVEAAVALMTTRNEAGAAAALAAGATGATDVTGFGLLGHLGRMALESGVDVDIETAAVPFLSHARALAEQGLVPGGSKRNLRAITPQLEVGDTDEITVALLADAQTSGGLVFGVEPSATRGVLDELTAAGLRPARIGRSQESPGRGRLRLV